MEGDKRKPSENSRQTEKESQGDNMSVRNSILRGKEDDEAAEKLVPEDGEADSNKNATEVKFISADSQNGDAKIDIENVKIAFAGMGKEELMKFANDPFWIRVRWLLFVFFWVLWLAMLAGAIAIIVMAPKCAAPAPLKWWEQGPLYQVDVRSFKDGSEPQDGVGDLQGLTSQLKYVKNLGAQGLVLSPIFKQSDYSASITAVENFTDVDPVFGTLADFKALIEEVKKQELHVVLVVEPNHSSNKHLWFNSSEHREEPYTDYYIWKTSPATDQDSGARLPPNNWLSVNGGSAWEWSDVRQEFYLHQFDAQEPDLNYHNPAVVQEIKDVLEFWLDKGVSGFQLGGVDYLLEDINLTNESHGSEPGFTHDQYGFYNHYQTTNQPGLPALLQQWKEVVVNHTGDGLFTAVRTTTSDLIGDKSVPVLELSQNIHLLSRLGRGFEAQQLNDVVQTWINQTTNTTRPVWQVGGPGTSRVASRLGADYVDPLNMVFMLLTGTPLTYLGDELGLDGPGPIPWNNDTNSGFSDSEPWLPIVHGAEFLSVAAQNEAEESHLKVYRELAELRTSQSVMFGSLDLAVINSSVTNSSVFAFTRVKSGNPGYIVTFNPSANNVTVDLATLDNVSGELTVHLHSTGFEPKRSKVSSNGVSLSPLGALVLTYVPNKE
uniref:alpha-glucosidase n=1 Tax=Timema shepardi TaxID=629360 RepID=A0A7R9FW48_TIMSH|nr:unnamed protein product [Timema shepardi]